MKGAASKFLMQSYTHKVSAIKEAERAKQAADKKRSTDTIALKDKLDDKTPKKEKPAEPSAVSAPPDKGGRKSGMKDKGGKQLTVQIGSALKDKVAAQKKALEEKQRREQEAKAKALADKEEKARQRELDKAEKER